MPGDGRPHRGPFHPTLLDASVLSCVRVRSLASFPAPFSRGFSPAVKRMRQCWPLSRSVRGRAVPVPPVALEHRGARGEGATLWSGSGGLRASRPHRRQGCRFTFAIDRTSLCHHYSVLVVTMTVMLASLPTAAPADEAGRHYRGSLVRALGAEVLAALADPDVTEVYVNPSGQLYLDTRSQGRVATATTLPADRVTRFLNQVAS